MTSSVIFNRSMSFIGSMELRCIAGNVHLFIIWKIWKISPFGKSGWFFSSWFFSKRDNYKINVVNIGQMQYWERQKKPDDLFKHSSAGIISRVTQHNKTTQTSSYRKKGGLFSTFKELHAVSFWCPSIVLDLSFFEWKKTCEHFVLRLLTEKREDI